MLVQCPNCKTTYKVSDDVLTGAAPSFRCSRCRHTFELEAQDPPTLAIEPTQAREQELAKPVAAQELSFFFPAKEVEQQAANPQAESERSIASVGHSSARGAENREQWSMESSESQKIEASFTLPELTSTDKAERGIPPAKQAINDATSPSIGSDAVANESNNVLPMSFYIDKQASIKPYLTLFSLLVIGYSLIAVLSYAHPKASEDLVKQIPLFGASVLKNSHLKEGILLQSLRGSYQTIQGNREVFVVTGVALNQNPVVVREIQLTGKVYNDAGKEFERQTIWIGNTISTKIIRGMTPEDIPHLQSLKPLKSFEMPPGDSVPFAIVFLKAAKGAKNFSCEAALVEGEF